MKVNITLKDEQKECLDKVTSDLSLENNEKTIHKLIHGIFELNQNDDIFGDYRCVGDCYSTEQSVEIELDDETVSKIKDIFQKYDFDDYDSEEEINKIIKKYRSIKRNFVSSSLMNFLGLSGRLAAMVASLLCILLVRK